MWKADIRFLFHLPNAWLVSLLSEWLNLLSIGKLDVAVSCKEHRPQFLKSLQVMRSTSIDKFSSCSYRCHSLWRSSDWVGCWWRWLSIRQIHTEKIYLRSNAVRSDLVIPSMQNVVTGSLENDDFCYLVRNCPSLRSLDTSSHSENARHD